MGIKDIVNSRQNRFKNILVGRNAVVKFMEVGGSVLWVFGSSYNCNTFSV